MKIENNILEISKVMFTNRNNWKHVTDEQKETFFFIFNRYFSKKYANLSQLLNDKEIDKTIGMDLWFYYMANKPYPQWFWSKTKKSLTSDNEQEKMFDELKMTHNLKDQELKFIQDNYPDEIKEELNYLKSKKNGNTREKMVHSKSTK